LRIALEKTKIPQQLPAFAAIFYFLALSIALSIALSPKLRGSFCAAQQKMGAVFTIPDS
jgi:hypothetical protein